MLLFSNVEAIWYTDGVCWIPGRAGMGVVNGKLHIGAPVLGAQLIYRAEMFAVFITAWPGCVVVGV